MYPDVKKLLKEPLLWVGAIALCIPVLASGQLGKLKESLSFDHGGPVAHPVSIAKDANPTSKNMVTPAIKIDRSRIGSQARDLATTSDGSSTKDHSRSREPSPMRDTPMTALPKMHEPEMTMTTPEISVPELTDPEPEVVISPLPKTDDSSEPGSLLDAASTLGYENTPEPTFNEPTFNEPALNEPEFTRPRYSASENTDSQNSESFELSFDDQPESPTSLDSVPELHSGNPSRNAREQHTESLSNLDSATDFEGQQEPSLVVDQQSSSLPSMRLPAMESTSIESQSANLQSFEPLPMKFQAALGARTGNGSQAQHAFEAPVSTHFQAAIPTNQAPEANSRQPDFSPQFPSLRRPLPQVMQPRLRDRARGNAIGIWDQ